MSERTSEAQAIQQQMSQIRRELGDDVDSIRRNVRGVTDWKAYVRSYPWACLAGAAAIGYLVVPKHYDVVQPDAETLTEMADKDRVVVKRKPEPHPRDSLTATLATIAANALVRSVVSFIGQRLGSMGGQQVADSAESE